MQTHSLDLEASSSQTASITNAAQTGLGLTTDFSFEAWIKLESLEGRIVSKTDTDTGSGGYLFGTTSGGELIVQYEDGSANQTQILSTNASLATGIWYHVACAVDISGATGSLYVNGRSLNVSTVFSNATSLGTNALDFNIGVGLSNGTLEKYSDGLVKDVRVFSDIRSQAEIVSDAHTENVVDANLQGEWNFNNAYTDSSGNGNDLTATNSPVFSTTIPWTAPTQGSDMQNIADMVEWWTMDEVSGTREGAHSTNDLTDNNTVGNTTGKWDLAADFEVDNSEYLSITDNASLSITGNIGIACWLNSESISGDRTIASKWLITGNQRSYRLVITSTAIRLDTSSAGSGETNGSVSFSFSTATTYHVAVGVFSGTAYFYVDGILIGTATVDSSIFDSTAAFAVGAVANPANYFDGWIDELSIYNAGLDYGNVLDLYAGGAGIPYAGGTAYTQELTESVNATDDTDLETSKNLTESITAAATIILNTGKALVESVTATASAVTDLILNKALTESVTTTVTASAKITVKYVSESVTATANIVRDLTRSITESVTANDAITNVFSYVKSFTESVTANVTATAKISAKVLTENVTVNAVISTIKDFSKVFTESVTVAVTVARSTGKAITNSVSTNATLAKVLTATRSFTESVNVRARLYGLLNGVNMLWKNKYVAKAGTWINKYLDNK